MRIREDIIERLRAIESQVVRLSLSANLKQIADTAGADSLSSSERRARLVSLRSQSEAIGTEIGRDAYEVHRAIARAEAEAAEWRRYAETARDRGEELTHYDCMRCGKQIELERDENGNCRELHTCEASR